MDEIIPLEEIKKLTEEVESRAEIVLTDEQWAMVVAEWNKDKNNPPSLTKLVHVVSGDLKQDGRGRLGRAIKKRMAKKKMDYITTSPTIQKVFTLTDEQKEYIKNHFDQETNVEMARILFNNSDITAISRESRAILAYMRESGLEKQAQGGGLNNNTVRFEYSPPADLYRLISRVNKWVRNINLEKDKISKKQEKELDKLKGYLDGYRFRYQINSYEKISDRELFESSFIRYTYDKPDLTEEEVDQYIALCTEIVMGGSLFRMSERLEAHLDTQSSQDDPKIHMGLVEAVNAARKEYNQCIMRQEKLLNALKQKRSEKDLKKKDATASILNLVEVWRQEDTRLQMLKMAEKRQQIVLEEFDRLDNLEDLKCRILGINKEDIFS